MEEERLQHYSANAQKETQVGRAMQHIFTPLAGHSIGLAGDAAQRVLRPRQGFQPCEKLRCNSSDFAK